MIHIRLPNISGKTEQEQLSQMKSFLFQLVQELNWAFQILEREADKSGNEQRN